MHSSGFRLVGEGAASTRYTNVALSATGSHDFEWPALWRATYGAGYRFQDQPVEDRNDLEQRYAFGWLSAATRPVRGLDVPIRYAVQLETGSQTHDCPRPASNPTPPTRPPSSWPASRAASGPTTSASTWATRSAPTAPCPAAWHKILLDGAYGVRVAPSTPFFDHRSLDLEPGSPVAGSSPGGVGPGPPERTVLRRPPPPPVHRDPGLERPQRALHPRLSRQSIPGHARRRRLRPRALRLRKPDRRLHRVAPPAAAPGGVHERGLPAGHGGAEGRGPRDDPELPRVARPGDRRGGPAGRARRADPHRTADRGRGRQR